MRGRLIVLIRSSELIVSDAATMHIMRVRRDVDEFKLPRYRELVIYLIRDGKIIRFVYPLIMSLMIKRG